MNRCFYLIFVLFIVSACNNTTNNTEQVPESEDIVIQGVLSDGSDQLVSLDLMEPDEFVSIDSVRCDESGHFTFIFKGEGVNFYSLKYTDDGYVTIIARAGDRIQLTGNSKSIYPYQIEGSEATILVSKLAFRHKTILEELSQISMESNEILGSENYVKKKQILNDRFDSISRSFQQYSRNFIIENQESPAILIALYNQFGPGLPVFHPLNDFDIYKFADSALHANFPENAAVKSLHSQISTALQQEKNLQLKANLKRGMRAPDFVLSTPDGKKIALAELRGNFVLLQFWASWSKPSVEENTFLRECYSKHGKNNFAILQVSIDSNMDEWTKALGEKMPNWYHVSDLRRWESVVLDLYRVERIPANFLIDPDGKIIEIDIFGEDLVQTMDKYIH